MEYSVGIKYTYFGERSLTNIVLSRFMLDNQGQIRGKRPRFGASPITAAVRSRINPGWKTVPAQWLATDQCKGFEEVKYETDTYNRGAQPRPDQRNYTY